MAKGRTKKRLSMKPKRAGRSPSQAAAYLKYIIPILALVAGQFLFLRGSHLAGMALSLAAVLVGAAFLSGWSLKPRAFSFKSFSFKKVPWKGLAATAAVVAALVLGVLGQSQWIHPEGGDATLWRGLWFYLAAVVLLIAGLWPWKKEGLQRLPLSPKVEWTAFGLIMAVALFYRLYHIAEIPAGIFIDEGFAGYLALKVIHEGYHFFYLPEPHQHPSLFIYLLALWFKVLSPTAVHFTLFSVFMGVASLPFIYWTYRQWAGPRVALVGLFILSVMRWNINFTRNSMRTETMPVFMFAAISFFLYGYQNQKRWALAAGGFFLGAGLYTYQSYKIFPFLIILYLAYELAANFKKFKANLPGIGIAALLFLLWAAPLLHLMWEWKSFGPREASISMLAKIQQDHSIQPLVTNTVATALMFNRRGDPNPRHNLQDHRMLDDVTGVLFVLGVFYALRYAYRRKYFYALLGFFIMSLPCLLSTDAAHANRMMGTTPFICFLAAVPIAALWGRIRALFGQAGEIVLVLLLAVPLYFMAAQNFHDYFDLQANNFASWAEFSTPETSIGKAINVNGDAYEYYLSPRFYNHYTILFLGYFEQNHTHPLRFPEAILPASAPPGRGLFYAFERGREGVLDEIKSVYPGGKEEDVKGPNGETVVTFYFVPASSVDAARGLKAELSGPSAPQQVAGFPSALPPGPYHGVFTGSIFIDQTSDYRFIAQTNGTLSWWISGRRVTPTAALHLVKGFHSVKLVLDAPAHPTLALSATYQGDRLLLLDSGHFAAFSANRGLLASFYDANNWKGQPALVQWDPVINYVNGNDFPPVTVGSIHWAGILDAPRTGTYRFLEQTPDQAGLDIDRKQVILLASNGNATVYLTKGPHALDIYYSRASNWFSSFSLLWVKPGSTVAEVIPNSAFGEIQ